MKNKKIITILAIVAFILAAATIIIPVFPGLERVSPTITELYPAYDFVFGNSAAKYSAESNGAMIGAFVLNIIALAFCLLGVLFLLPEGTKKFGSFLLFVGGGCVLATGIIFILAKSILNLDVPNESVLNLKFGFLGSGIAGIASGAIALCGGFLGMASKK